MPPNEDNVIIQQPQHSANDSASNGDKSRLTKGLSKQATQIEAEDHRDKSTTPTTNNVEAEICSLPENGKNNTEMIAEPAPETGKTDMLNDGESTGELASLQQQKPEDGMLPARACFLASVCHVCKRAETGLQACGGCRLIYYCSRQHQRAHWSLHRPLCRAAAVILRQLKLTHLCQPPQQLLDRPDEWKRLRVARLQLVERQLGRQLQLYEQEMLLFPRACGRCHDTRRLTACSRCRAVYSCRDDHRDPDHDNWCQQLLKLEQLHEYQNKHGLCDPHIELVTGDAPGLAADLTAQLFGGRHNQLYSAVERMAASEKASYPLSALFALQKVWGQKKLLQLDQLILHVVGAESGGECFDLFVWETVMLHLLPGLQRLLVVFVGADLDAGQQTSGDIQVDLTCPDCQTAGRRAACHLVSHTLYHQYCDRADQTNQPDLVCAFNAGLYGREGLTPQQNLWTASLPRLLRPATPLLVSAYTEHESRRDLHRLQEIQAALQIQLEPIRNPFGSLQPARNFIDEHHAPLVYKNQYMICVQNNK